MNDNHAINRVKRDVTVRSLMMQFGLTNVLNQDINEFAINKPLEYWTEDSRGWHQHKNELLTLSNLQGLARAISVYNHKTLDADNPINSLTLPDGERCQVVLPPVTENGMVNFTIRKPSDSRFILSDYTETGRLSPKLSAMNDQILDWESDLLALSKAHRFDEFFRLAVKHKLNVVTVGGTGSGKTTFSKTLIDLYPKNKRIFTIENAHELTTPYHDNAVHLFYTPTITAKQVLASCMRMKPDHIFLTELLGDETWDYLMALKSGHNGSVTSIHANDCRGAFYKIASYIKQSEVGRTLDFEYILREVMTTIDAVIFFKNTYLEQFYYDPEKKLKLLKGAPINENY